MSETTVAVCTEKIRIANRLLREVLAHLEREGGLSDLHQEFLKHDVLAVMFELKRAVRRVPEFDTPHN